MRWKRYAIVFGFSLIIANGYTFWPALAYLNTFTSCPAIIGPLSYQVEGASQIVGAPLYSQMQIVMHPGSTAYEMEIHQSSIDNLTQVFQNYPSNGGSPVIQYLYKINSLGGSLQIVGADEAGVTITYQNKTFEGIHVAVFPL